jgi:DNA-binding CsgD family transcriptional regulator
MAMSDSPAPAPDRRSRGHRGPRLFERGAFLDEFEAIFSGSLPVPSRCIAIEGSWGSGRTALINAAADLASRSECIVLRAKGGTLEEHTPFAVLGRLVESAEVRAEHHEDIRERAVALDGLLADRRAVAAGERPAHRSPAESRPSDDHRIASLFHRILVSLRQVAPVLVVIDDADQADPETLAALQYLVRRLEHQQIWLVVSARPLHAGVGLRPIDGLLTEPDTRQFILEPLHQSSVEAVVAGLFEVRPDPEFVQACTEATGGSPFLLKALLPALLRGGVVPTAHMAASLHLVRAPKITQFVLTRLAQLPPAATDLLQAAALLGEAADPGVARQLARMDALTADQSAAGAEQMELLLPGRPLRFTSPVIRWAVYHDIPAVRRSELHRAAADLLDVHGADDDDVAEHLLATEPAGDPELGHRLQQIGRRAQVAGHGDLALRCLERALLASPLANRPPTLYLDLAAAEVATRGSQALHHLRRAIELGDFDGGTVVRVGVDLLGRQGQDQDLRAEVLTTLLELRPRLGAIDRDLRIELELTLAMAFDTVEPRIECVNRLRALLAEPGDNGTASARRARSMVALSDVLSSPDLSADAAAVALEQIVDVDQLVGTDPTEGWIQATALFGLLGTDRFARVDDILSTARTRVTHPDGSLVHRRISALSVLSLVGQGSLVAADDECTRIEEDEGARATGTEAYPVTGHLDVLVQQGRLDEAERLAESTQPGRIGFTVFPALSLIERGRLLMAQGRPVQALEAFTAGGDAATRAGILNPAMVPWRADAVMALVDQEAWERAGQLADENLRLARAFGAPRITGMALRASAAATSDPETRSALLGEAVAVLADSDARLEHARTLVDLGSTLIDLDRKEEARGVLRLGASLASLCGAHQLLELAGEQLRAAGARPRRLGLVGPDSLTPAELRVVRMAADGLTNQRIADDLYVTLKTVEGHLAKAYRKLGVDGRPALAEALAVANDGDDGDIGELYSASAV